MKPTICVCIPTYNGSKFLKQSMESVLSQTYSDFEVVISDDCSSDTTMEILEQFRRKEPRIKIYRNKENIGYVRNWNKCLELAEGEWIKFLFQDDLLESKCIERLLNVYRGES